MYKQLLWGLNEAENVQTMGDVDGQEEQYISWMNKMIYKLTISWSDRLNVKILF